MSSKTASAPISALEKPADFCPILDGEGRLAKEKHAHRFFVEASDVVTQPLADAQPLESALFKDHIRLRHEDGGPWWGWRPSRPGRSQRRATEYCEDPGMVWWLGRERQKTQQIEAEADALIAGLGLEAYAEARQRERDANDLGEARFWDRVAVAIARKTCERLGIDTETRLAPAASFPVLDLFAPAPARPQDLDRLSPIDRPLLAAPGAELSRSFRLQFLRVGPDGQLSMLTEVDVPASNVSDAIRSTAHLDWPPLAIGFRLFDANGREILGWQNKQGDAVGRLGSQS